VTDALLTQSQPSERGWRHEEDDMRGKPFEPGNKLGKGRKPGSKNKRTELQNLLEDRGEPIVQQCMLMAMQKDPTAMRLCMERLIPVARAPASIFQLPKMETAADLRKVVPSVLKQMSQGLLSAPEGESIGRLVDVQGHRIEAFEFDKRLRALEEDSSRLKLIEDGPSRLNLVKKNQP
jgi:hypothetical protein